MDRGANVYRESLLVPRTATLAIMMRMGMPAVWLGVLMAVGFLVLITIYMRTLILLPGLFV